ncbi:adenylyl-sulfate kinase [bacterium]|jgi:adenylylsulfate kinase|nr:adenylyl-sulfate kinase [bacterium]
MKISKNFSILWLTGMSGSGKSTLAFYIKKMCKENGYKVKIIDGDDVRDKDEKKLGFGYEDVLRNNLRIAEFCLDLKNKGVEIVIVPVISPYEKVRKKVKDMLSPFLHLIYIKANINSLKERDTKGLYLAADRGEIDNLIGYSDINPYDEPYEPSIIIETDNDISLDKSKKKLFEYVKNCVIYSNQSL